MKGRAAVLAISALIVGGCRANSPPASAPMPPPPSSPIASPATGLGAGTPGAFCATNRLGKRFTKDGVAYVCKGPKPYRWRTAS